MNHDLFSDKLPFIDIRPFGAERTYSLDFYGLTRDLAIYRDRGGLGVVGNADLSFGSDVEFTRLAARKLYSRVKDLQVDCIVTVESRASALAFELSRLLRLDRFAVVLKKPRLDTDIVSLHTIRPTATSDREQTLYLDRHAAGMITGKSIVLLDDVISTGSTLDGLLALAVSAGCRIAAVAAVWLEGPWSFERLDRLDRDCRIVYLDVLPLYAEGALLDKLHARTRAVEEAYYRTLEPGAAAGALSRSWGIAPGDRVLILTDRKASGLFVSTLVRLLDQLGAVCHVHRDLSPRFHDDLPEAIREALPACDVAIFAASQSWYHAPARREAKYRHNKRVIEAYGMVPGLFRNGGLFGDHDAMAELGNDLLKGAGTAGRIEISSLRGTRLHATYSSAGVEHGRYRSPGTGGNVPAGELSFGITAADAEGSVVLDVSFDRLGTLSDFPLTLHVRNGMICVMEGEEAGILRGIIAKDPRLLSLAEIGIGINPSCIAGRSILEDEKKAGNAHIGFGNNSYFGGGRGGAHYDGVFADATISVNGKRIITCGKFHCSLLSSRSRRFLEAYGMCAD